MLRKRFLTLFISSMLILSNTVSSSGITLIDKSINYDKYKVVQKYEDISLLDLEKDFDILLKNLL